MPIDTLLAYVGVYDSVDDAEADALEEALVARLVEANRRRREGGPP